MKQALESLLAALDEAPAPVSVFIRDDDGGWCDTRLFALIDLTLRHGVPLDVAVIPQAMDTVAARELRSRHDAATGLLGLHQHGFSHMNHEPQGRACEFGPARALARQRNDLRLGRQRLLGHLGHRLDPIFTPPWNRCSEDSPALLRELGFEALSRSRGAPPQSVLPELPVDIDWSKLERAAREALTVEAAVMSAETPCLPAPDAAAVEAAVAQRAGSAILRAMTQRVRDGGPVGLMLHHAKMSAASLALLDSLLGALHPHPRLTWRLMADLLGLPARRPLQTPARCAA